MWRDIRTRVAARRAARQPVDPRPPRVPTEAPVARDHRAGARTTPLARAARATPRNGSAPCRRRSRRRRPRRRRCSASALRYRKVGPARFIGTRELGTVFLRAARRAAHAARVLARPPSAAAAVVRPGPAARLLERRRARRPRADATHARLTRSLAALAARAARGPRAARRAPRSRGPRRASTRAPPRFVYECDLGEPRRCRPTVRRRGAPSPASSERRRSRSASTRKRGERTVDARAPWSGRSSQTGPRRLRFELAVGPEGTLKPSAARRERSSACPTTSPRCSASTSVATRLHRRRRPGRPRRLRSRRGEADPDQRGALGDARRAPRGHDARELTSSAAASAASRATSTRARSCACCPGMQAAFVDIGLEKAAFLHVSDLAGRRRVRAVVEEPRARRGYDARAWSTRHAAGGPVRADRGAPARRARRCSSRCRRSRSAPRARASPRTSRSPAATSSTCPARDHIGISRRIEDPAERDRLREIVEAERPAEGGFIVRTACEGATKREIHDDIRFLTRLWARVQKTRRRPPTAPALVHADLDLVLRTRARPVHRRRRPARGRRPGATTRACSSSSTGADAAPRARACTSTRARRRSSSSTASRRRSPAPSSAACGSSRAATSIFDQTESLTTVDVNTGRYVGKKDQEETVLRTNLEAAQAGRPAAPPAQHRRHHRHRLHRHGEGGEPAEGVRRAPGGAAEGQGALERAAHLRARPGADDAQADAREPRSSC